jgi:hypothetical protein
VNLNLYFATKSPGKARRVPTESQVGLFYFVEKFFSKMHPVGSEGQKFETMLCDP